MTLYQQPKNFCSIQRPDKFHFCYILRKLLYKQLEHDIWKGTPDFPVGMFQIEICDPGLNLQVLDFAHLHFYQTVNWYVSLCKW